MPTQVERNGKVYLLGNALARTYEGLLRKEVDDKIVERFLSSNATAVVNEGEELPRLPDPKSAVVTQGPVSAAVTADTGESQQESENGKEISLQ